MNNPKRSKKVPETVKCFSFYFQKEILVIYAIGRNAFLSDFKLYEILRNMLNFPILNIEFIKLENLQYVYCKEKIYTKTCKTFSNEIYAFSCMFCMFHGWVVFFNFRFSEMIQKSNFSSYLT